MGGAYAWLKIAEQPLTIPQLAVKGPPYSVNFQKEG